MAIPESVKVIGGGKVGGVGGDSIGGVVGDSTGVVVVVTVDSTVTVGGVGVVTVDSTVTVGGVGVVTVDSTGGRPEYKYINITTTATTNVKKEKSKIFCVLFIYY